MKKGGSKKEPPCKAGNSLQQGVRRPPQVNYPFAMLVIMPKAGGK
jgi:hypothetical protein